MEKHITIVAVIHIGFGILGMVIGALIFLVVVGGGMLSGDLEAMGITTVVGTVVGGFIFLLSLPSIIGGFGLLKRHPWARILILIVSVLHLIDIPIGTAAGIYSIWVLGKAETAVLFETPAPVKA